MYQLFERYFPNVVQLKQEFFQNTWEALYIAFQTALIAGVLGVLLDIVPVSTSPSDVLKNPLLYSVLEETISIYRSTPSVIMLVLIQPLTRILTGAIIGTTAVLVPLAIGVIPLFARQIENALLEVDPGVIEATEAIGTSPLRIIFRVCLIEGLPSIIRVPAVTITNLIGLTTVTGTIRANGLDNLAITRGYNRFQADMTFVATLIILIMVFISQVISS